MAVRQLRQLNVQVPADLIKRLRKMAEDQDRSMSAETRQAIETRLSEWERGRHRRADADLDTAEQAA